MMIAPPSTHELGVRSHNYVHEVWRIVEMCIFAAWVIILDTWVFYNILKLCNTKRLQICGLVAIFRSVNENHALTMNIITLIKSGPWERCDAELEIRVPETWIRECIV